MLKLVYTDFKSKVRIQDRTSNWYTMECGIHQGGFLSLLKYVAFINSLLVNLKNSELCIHVNGIKCTPVGYADDMSAATNSKVKMDRVLRIINSHGNRWRYEYNASKSAILVHGETKKVWERNSKFRCFKLGARKIREKEEYEHVGIINTIPCSEKSPIDNRLSKGRRTLNAATGLGIKRNGLNMAVCNLIFWNVVVPTTLYGCEVWIITEKDIEKIENFQKQSGKRIQRFNQYSPTHSCIYGLGWMDLNSIICIRKLLFIHTIIRLGEDNMFMKLLKNRARTFNDNINICIENEYKSPIFEILRVSLNLGLYDDVMRMIFGRTVYSKPTWKARVWDITWKIEDLYWRQINILYRNDNLLFRTTSNPRYLTWWHISDLLPSIMRNCEDMAKMVCGTSELKAHKPKLKREILSKRVCTLCDFGSEENVTHIVMQCHFHENTRRTMYENLESLRMETMTSFNGLSGEEKFLTLMGKYMPDIDPEEMLNLWCISSKFISRIYRITLSKHADPT